MMAIIKDRLHRRVCDDVLEVAWSTMWNVTDEAPTNCKRFLDGNGMKYFLGCLAVRIVICKLQCFFNLLFLFLILDFS